MGFECPPIKVSIPDGVTIDEAALAAAIAMALGRSMDLEVVCDATTGDRIFVRMETDDAGVSTYTNAETGAVITPGTDFVPCGTTADIDVEWHRLCDDVNGDGSLLVPFRRMTIATTDAAGAPVSLTPLDFEIDTATAYVVQGDVVECAEDCPSRFDTGICDLVEVTAAAEWSITGQEMTITNVALPANADVREYTVYWGEFGRKTHVIGGADATFTYSDPIPQQVSAVISNGEYSVTLAIDTSEPFGTVAATAAVRVPLIREVDCEGVTVGYFRCLDGQPYTPTNLVKCDSYTVLEPPVKIDQTCYVDYAASAARIEWDQSQVWDAGNPDIIAAAADLVAGNPVTFTNVMGTGNDVTITPTGTIDSLDYVVGTTALQLRVANGLTGGLDFAFSSPLTLLYSTGPVGDGDTLSYSSTENILATQRTDLGSIPASISDSGTTNPTVAGIAGNDRTHASATGTSGIDVSYINNSAGVRNLNLGIYISEEPAYWTACAYDNGAVEISSSSGGTAPAIGDTWQPVPCADVPGLCEPVPGSEIIVGAGAGFDLLSGSAGVWTPGSNDVVAALSISVKTIGDTNNPPVITDSRGISTPIATPMDINWGSTDEWGAPSFTNVPSISYSNGDVICVAWTYAETGVA